ncbi:MAG: UPF0175 family protein [Vulcanimicrobiota bacterium]
MPSTLLKNGKMRYNRYMALIEIPEDISREEAKLFLAMKLFEEGKMSLGQASGYAGFSKKSFIEILGKHKIPVIDYPNEELEEDLKNA